MDTGFNRETHQATAACRDFHCLTHQRDEPTEGYRLCAECGHMFLAPEELVAEDFRMATIAYVNGWDKRPPRELAPELIYACPHCTHDF